MGTSSCLPAMRSGGPRAPKISSLKGRGFSHAVHFPIFVIPTEDFSPSRGICGCFPPVVRFVILSERPPVFLGPLFSRAGRARVEGSAVHRSIPPSRFLVGPFHHALGIQHHNPLFTNTLLATPVLSRLCRPISNLLKTRTFRAPVTPMNGRLYSQSRHNTELTHSNNFSFPRTSPICQHIMISGRQCGSPALTGRSHCYYHDSLSRMLPKSAATWQSYRNQNGDRIAMIPMPLLEDATALQTAYMQIIHGVLSGDLDLPRARIVLSALKAAARNLPLVQREQAAAAQAAAEAEPGYVAPTDTASPEDSDQEPEIAVEAEAIPQSYLEFRRRMQHPEALADSSLDSGTEDPPRKRATSAAADDGRAARDLAGD